MNSIRWFNTTFKGLNAWLAVVSVDHGNLNKLFTSSCAKKIQATRQELTMHVPWFLRMNSVSPSRSKLLTRGSVGSFVGFESP